MSNKSAGYQLETKQFGANGTDNLPTDTALDNVDEFTSYYMLIGGADGTTVTANVFDMNGNQRLAYSYSLDKGQAVYASKFRNVNVTAGSVIAVRMFPFDYDESVFPL